MHLSLALEKPPKVEAKVVEKPKPKKGDKKADKKDAKKSPKKESKKCCDDNKGVHDEDKEFVQEFAFQNLVKMMSKSDSLQCIHLSNNGFNEQTCIAL